MREVRKMNIIFTKSGSGSLSPRITLPKSWVEKMGITTEDREVYITFDDDTIIIKKEKVIE